MVPCVQVDQINALAGEVSGLSDEALRARTVDFRRRHERGESLDSLLVEVFAVRAPSARSPACSTAPCVQ